MWMTGRGECAARGAEGASPPSDQRSTSPAPSSARRSSAGCRVWMWILSRSWSCCTTRLLPSPDNPCRGGSPFGSTRTTVSTQLPSASPPAVKPGGSRTAAPNMSVTGRKVCGRSENPLKNPSMNRKSPSAPESTTPAALRTGRVSAVERTARSRASKMPGNPSGGGGGECSKYRSSSSSTVSIVPGMGSAIAARARSRPARTAACMSVAGSPPIKPAKNAAAMFPELPVAEASSRGITVPGSGSTRCSGARLITRLRPVSASATG